MMEHSPSRTVIHQSTDSNNNNTTHTNVVGSIRRLFYMWPFRLCEDPTVRSKHHRHHHHHGCGEDGGDIGSNIDIHPPPSSSNSLSLENETPSSPSMTTASMIQLPKGTMAYRYRVVTYIGILVTLFLIGSILFSISIAAVPKNHSKNQIHLKKDATTHYRHHEELNDLPQRRDMYRYYSNLIVKEISSLSLVPNVARTSTSTRSTGSTTALYGWDIRHQLLQPQSSEYQALQWLFVQYDDITITTLSDLMMMISSNPDDSPETTQVLSSAFALLQRFAVTTIYIHFQLYSYMIPHIHECEWEGTICGNSESTNVNEDDDDDDDSAKMITGINITSLLLFVAPSSSQSTTTGTDLNNTTPVVVEVSSPTANNEMMMASSPQLGTAIPVMICYVSKELRWIDLSKLDLVGTIPPECYFSTFWDKIQEIHLEQNQLQHFFTVPMTTTTTTSTAGYQPTTMYQPTVWWPQLRYINLIRNQLKESIFDSIYTTVGDDDLMNNMDNINNSTSFTVTTSIFDWHQLEYLHVSGNPDLMGTLFESASLWYAWPNIKVIDISETSITGTIADPYDDRHNNRSNTNATEVLSQLTTFTAYRTPLGGSVPHLFGRATNLEVLALGLSGNVWTGTLPESYGNLTALHHLSLSHLIGITGTLPASWGYGMTQLESIDLFGNADLSGSIPKSWGGMTNLATLRLAQTNISGTIPSELGKLTRLVDASFHRTNLQGSVPSEICQLRKDYVLSRLSVDCIADTLASNSKERVPTVSCSQPDCCTSCT